MIVGLSYAIGSVCGVRGAPDSLAAVETQLGETWLIAGGPPKR